MFIHCFAVDLSPLERSRPPAAAGGNLQGDIPSGQFLNQHRADLRIQEDQINRWIAFRPGTLLRGHGFRPTLDQVLLPEISISMSLHRRFRPFWRAYRLWLRADCVDLSAAFAYHTLQSLFPAILIALSFASRLLGRDRQLIQRLVEVMTQVMPESALPFFLQALEKFTRQGFGAGILGAILLVLSANNIYLTLQRGADRLWWNRPYDFEHLRWSEMLHRFIVLRLKAFLLLVLVALLMVADQFISNIRFFGSTSLHHWFVMRLPIAWQWLVSVSLTVDVLFSILLSFLATLVLLWLLPSRGVALRHMVPGALLISLVLTLLSLLLGRSLVALGVRFQAYGLVGGVLVLTLWVWMVGLILYYGQCLSVVMADRPPGWRSTLSDLPSEALRR